MDESLKLVSPGILFARLKISKKQDNMS